MDKKLMEQRAKFVEKAKKISMEPEMEDKPRKSGGRVSKGGKGRRPSFMEMAKKISLETEMEDKPRKSGAGRVSKKGGREASLLESHESHEVVVVKRQWR